MRIVIDASVLVAAARSSRGASFLLLSLIPDRRFQICLSQAVYLEYVDVLSRPEHLTGPISITQSRNMLRYLASQAHLQEIYFRWRPFLPDADDDMLLELAVAARSQHIVTFNTKDFRGIERFGISALRPRDFLVEIGELK